MPGIITLFFLWILWILSTFIMDKQRSDRLLLAFFSLVMIIFMPISFRFFSIYITAPSLITLLVCYFQAAKMPIKKQLHLLISTFTFMLGFTGFLLVEMYDPVWVIIDRKILLTFFLFLLSYLICPASIGKRLLIVFLGTLQGDIIFSYILAKRNMTYVIGSLELLDIISITVITILISSIGKYLSTLQKNKKIQVKRL